jgi:YfiH family protein
MSSLTELSPALRPSEGVGPVFFRFRALAAAPGLRHAVSSRLGGRSLGPLAESNMSFRSTEPTEVTLANREALASRAGIPLARWVTGWQVHGATVARVGLRDCGRGARDPASREQATDGLVTTEAGVAVAVFGADCALALLWSPEKPALAVAHAGWRGLAAGVLRRAVEELSALARVEPGDLRAALAPAIRACCYTVGPEVKEALARAPGELAAAFVEREGRLWLDVEDAGVRQLAASGLSPEAVIRTGVCTACRRDLFYSARGDGEPTGRFVLVAMLEEPKKQGPAPGGSGPAGGGGS